MLRDNLQVNSPPGPAWLVGNSNNGFAGAVQAVARPDTGRCPVCMRVRMRARARASQRIIGCGNGGCLGGGPGGR